MELYEERMLNCLILDNLAGRALPALHTLDGTPLLSIYLNKQNSSIVNSSLYSEVANTLFLQLQSLKIFLDKVSSPFLQIIRLIGYVTRYWMTENYQHPLFSTPILWNLHWKFHDLIDVHMRACLASQVPRQVCRHCRTIIVSSMWSILSFVYKYVDRRET